MAQPNYPTMGFGIPQPTPVDTDAPYLFDKEGLPINMAWPHNLVGAFSHRRRVTAPPQLSHDEDPTILIVVAHQEFHIQNMIRAIFTMDGIEDNRTFPGLYLFIRGDSKQASGYDVEAACRVLFSAVINRCLVGYCGPRASNRLLNQGNKYAAVDQNGTCQERINNVIKSLREWKSICKDILSSDSKIDALANAPASVWQDKMEQKRNNLAKKKSTQNDRKAAATAMQDGAAASQVAGGDLPPVVPAIRKNRPRSRRNAATVTASQDQTDSASLPSAPPSYGGSDRGGYALPFNNADLGVFPASIPMNTPYNSASRHPPFMNQPSFGFTRPDGPPPQNQQSRPWAPGNLGQFQPAPFGYAIPHSEYSQGPFQGQGSSEQQTHGFSGANSGLNPTMGNLSIGSGPVNNYNLAVGANAPQFHFHDLAMSPHHSDHPMFSAQGQFRGDSYISADEATFTDPMMPAHRGPEEVVPAGGLDDLSEIPQVRLPPKTATKHARTATMDAQAQPPEPTRMRRGQGEEEGSENLDAVEE